MNFLMLRGQVPIDRDPKEIMFNKLEECDDVWTQLFYAMLGDKDVGELWYWGGSREHKFTPTFTERWVPDFVTYKNSFVPDIIFCRGGFKEYHSVLHKYPNAIKIYYGAGRRFLPQPGFYNYDIILQDSQEQLEECKKLFPNALTTLFIKPAADNLFYPMPDVQKEFDVCFPANGSQHFKGHEFIYSTVPCDIKLLNLGNNPKGYKYSDNVTSVRVLRKQMCHNIARCKTGVVAVNSDIDSCPRVIPELLACGLPIVVLNTVKFWKDKYINQVDMFNGGPYTGELANKENFWDTVRFVLNRLDKYDSSAYYNNNLSLEKAAKFLTNVINKSKKRRYDYVCDI